MRESLALRDVAVLLRESGEGAGVLDLAKDLHARGGLVQKALYRLRELGAAQVRYSSLNAGSRWTRIAGIDFPDEIVKPGGNPNKPALEGDVGVAEGGISKGKRSPYALTLYGADPAAKRVPLSAIQMVERARARLAKTHAGEAFARAEGSAKASPSELVGLLSVEANALADAAELVRARIKRVVADASKPQPPVQGGQAGAAQPP